MEADVITDRQDVRDWSVLRVCTDSERTERKVRRPSDNQHSSQKLPIKITKLVN